MSNRYAVSVNGVVADVVLWDGVSPWTPPEGSTVTLLPDDSPVFPGYTFDGTNFTAPPVAPVALADAQSAQTAILSAACQAAIFAGFTCTTLGAAYTYPAKMTDQQNLASSVLASMLPGVDASWATPFWCADASGNWAWRNHSAAQIQAVGQAGMASVLTSQAKNATYAARVAAATTLAQVAAVVWGS